MDVGVEPHLAAAERRPAVALERDAVHALLGEQKTLGAAPLDGYLGEVLEQEDILPLLLRVEVERYLDDLGLTVRIGGEVNQTRAGFALGDVVFAVARDGGDIEALDVVRSLGAVAIDHVVGGAGVVALEHLHPLDILAHEYLVGYAYNLVFAVAVEDDDVVDVGAVADELIFLQPSADEAILTVDVELFVGLHHLRGLDGVERSHLGEARMILAVGVLEVLEPCDGHVGHVVEVVLDALNLRLDLNHELVGFRFVVFQDALHLDFEQTEVVVLGDVADELRLERCELRVEEAQNGLLVGCLLEVLLLIHALLDEDALQ